MTEEAKAALAELDAMTEKWWGDRDDLKLSVAQISAMVSGPFKERSFDLIVRMLKQAHTEGLFEAMQIELGLK